MFPSQVPSLVLLVVQTLFSFGSHSSQDKWVVRGLGAGNGGGGLGLGVERGRKGTGNQVTAGRGQRSLGTHGLGALAPRLRGMGPQGFSKPATLLPLTCIVTTVPFINNANDTEKHLPCTLPSQKAWIRDNQDDSITL